MSRCFPFPPPGYEKKARTEDTDLLRKEKQKEKKHKKEKKEKVKREGKEKRDKDRSQKKHREKKDRKEKHKDKDRDKDKEKNRAPDEKKVEGQLGCYNGEKFGSNGLQNGENDTSAYVEELARRIRDDEKASGSQMVQNVVALDQRRDEEWGMVVERNVSGQSQENNKVKNKNEDHRKTNGQRNHIDTRGLDKAYGQNLLGMDQERDEGVVRSVEKKDTEKQMEGNEKSIHDGKGDKHKSRDREKSRKSKCKDEDKREKKEKMKEITEPSNEQPKLKENVSKLKEASKDSLDFRNMKASETLKLSKVSPAAEGNLGKRKELERNGFLLDNENRPSKFLRPVPAPHLVVENEKKLEPCQTAVQIVSEKQGPGNDHELDIKEPKINGLIKAQQKINGLITGPKKINGLIAARPNVSSLKPSTIGVLDNVNGETFPKPPHPDTKYLSQLLSIPEVVEPPDVDDQDWLLCCNNLQSREPRVGAPVTDGTQLVWAEARRIESADISALPYVIPY